MGPSALEKSVPLISEDFLPKQVAEETEGDHVTPAYLEDHRLKRMWVGMLVGKLIFAKLECGPMPNVMAALPNISGALC